MTREEFMQMAKTEVRNALSSQENRLMNLVEQAWAEGKRNAEVDKLTELLGAAILTIHNREE